MTDQEINIAIAEACGWKDCGMGWFEHPQYMNPRLLAESLNYNGDLNAMHEAEKTMTNLQENIYFDFLSSHAGSSFGYLTSDAIDRAEAFLRTIGKWKD